MQPLTSEILVYIRVFAAKRLLFQFPPSCFWPALFVFALICFAYSVACYILFCLNSFSKLRIHWRLSTILKTRKKVNEVIFFWCVKTCIFWKCIQYAIHWDETQMFKKFPSDKINGTKNILFFLLRAPTHHSFTFNLRFLYELKRKVRLPKTLCGIFHFSFRFAFIKVYIFVQQNTWTLWL